MGKYSSFFCIIYVCIVFNKTGNYWGWGPNFNSPTNNKYKYYITLCRGLVHHQLFT